MVLILPIGRSCCNAGHNVQTRYVKKGGRLRLVAFVFIIMAGLIAVVFTKNYVQGMDENYLQFMATDIERGILLLLPLGIFLIVLLIALVALIKGERREL